MAANNILFKLMDAGKAYLLGQELTLVTEDEVFTGYDKNGVTKTRVVLLARRSEPFTGGDGLHNITLEVDVSANYNDMEPEDYSALCGEVFSRFMTGNVQLAAALSAAIPDFTVQQVITGGQEFTVKDHRWSTVLDIDCRMCGGTAVV